MDIEEKKKTFSASVNRMLDEGMCDIVVHYEVPNEGRVMKNWMPDQVRHDRRERTSNIERSTPNDEVVEIATLAAFGGLLAMTQERTGDESW